MKNLFKPLSITLLILVLTLCLGVFALAAEAEPASASSEPAEDEILASEFFTDLDDSAAPDTLRYMIDADYIFGFTDGSFRPGRSYTRLELAQLVCRLCGLDTAAESVLSFYDCDIAGADAIAAAVTAGLMTGRSADSFEPYGNVLKAEMIGTMEKCSDYLVLEGFYDHASGSFTDWDTDYTICTADEAMQCAYQLAQALELKAAAEAEAAEAEAAALAVAALTAENAGSDEPEDTASGEPEDSADTAGSASDEPAAVGFTPPAGDSAESTDAAESAETTETAASGEPAVPESTAQAESSTPPAGVITPESQAAAQTAAQTPAQAAAAEAETAAPEVYDESDALRNAIKDKYRDIRSQIVTFLLGVLG